MPYHQTHDYGFINFVAFILALAIVVTIAVLILGVVLS